MRKAVGLTGGIATGKSTVSKMFQDLGAVTISGDDIARDVLSDGARVLVELASEFGSEILTETAGLNRSVMLGKLLDSPERMTDQIRILSPYLLPVIDSEVKKKLHENPDKIVVAEAPLLFEYGQSHRYSPIVVVTVPLDIQLKRLMKRSGKSRQWAEKVINLQWTMDEKIKRADYVIDNSGNHGDTFQQVEQIFCELKQQSAIQLFTPDPS